MQCDFLREYGLPFAAWELRLYLNTHPQDRRALTAYWDLLNQQSWQDNYAAVDSSLYSLDNWNWIEGPWPWEPEANPAIGEV